MKKNFTTFAFVLCILFFATTSKAQIPVTVSGSAVTVPALQASYTSLAAALADLNAITSYTTPGDIIFTCTEGNSETAPPKGFVIGSATLNPLLDATNTVTVTVYYTGIGPVTINAGVGTSTPADADPDGIIAIVGADYVTINGLTLVDGNLANPATMEFGIGLFKMNASDGVQNCNITSCTITLNRINNAPGSGPAMDGSVGIQGYNSTPTAATTALTITDATGTNSNILISSDSIRNCNIGIGLTGFASATFGDYGNIIQYNVILNFGGGGTTSPAAGIRLRDQIGGCYVYINKINNNDGAGVNHAADLRGIYGESGISASVSIGGNTITLKSAATTSILTAIDNSIGATAASNNVQIYQNIITGCTYNTATSGVFTGIANTASATGVFISSNEFTNNSTNAASGTHYLIRNTGVVAYYLSITSNNINGWTLSPTTAAFICISNSAGASGCEVDISSNSFGGIVYNSASSGAFQCINTSATVNSLTIYNNNFNNLTVNTSASTLGYLISASNSTPSVGIVGNYVTTQFTNSNVTGGTNYLAISNASGAPTAGYATISENNLSNINYKTTTGFGAGIYWNSGSGAGCTHNITVTLNTVSAHLNSGGTPTQQAGAYGILVGLGSANTINNNTVTDINAMGGSAIGIFGGTVSTNPAGINTTNDNYVQNIRSSSTSATVGTNAIGIQLQSGPAGNEVYNNKVYDIGHTGIGTATGLGLSQSTAGSANNIYNNLIGRVTAPLSGFYQAVRGISLLNNVSNTIKVTYNNVSLGGNCAGQSYCVYMASVNPTITLNNNILLNESVPTSTLAQMVYFRVGTLTPTYTIASDNNLLYAGTPGPLHLIYADGAVNGVTNPQQTLAAFKTFVGPTRENYSFTGNPGLNADLSPNPANPNCWLINGNGIAISSIYYDILGNLRSQFIYEGGTDIGAYEFTPSVPPPVISVVPSAASDIAVSDFYYGGEYLASINPTTLGGLSQVDLQYYSGTVPPGLPSDVTDGYGNVYWNIQPTGTGYTYDLTIHYSPALLGTTVEANIKVAIENPPNNGQGYYTPYPQGTGIGESDVDFTNHNITVRGLTEMGRFIITDADETLPVELASFVSAINGRNVELNWATASETNNSGFDIERSNVRVQTSNEWTKIGNVEGNGTINSQMNYSFADKNLASGSYSYRLKQIDFNGNFEYFNLKQ